MNLALLGVLLLLQTGDPSRCDGRETVRLKLQVAHPAFGDVAGVGRVWALLRVPLAAGETPRSGETYSAAVDCSAAAACVTTALDGTAARAGDRLDVVYRFDADEPGAGWAVPAPFPVVVDAALAAKLAFENGRTKLIDAIYARSENGLELCRIDFDRAVDGDPKQWK